MEFGNLRYRRRAWATVLTLRANASTHADAGVLNRVLDAMSLMINSACLKPPAFHNVSALPTNSVALL